MSFSAFQSYPNQSLVTWQNGSGFNALPLFSGTERPVVSGSSAFTPGAFLEVVAALPFRTSRVVLTNENSSTDTELLFNIAIGNAGSEVIVFPNLPGRGNRTRDYDLPLALPRGARVSIQVQSAHTAAVTVPWSMAFIPEGPRAPAGFPRWTTLNVNQANHSFPLTHVAVWGVRSAWMELVASLPADVPIAVVSLHPILTQGGGNQGIPSLALGATGEEVAVAHVNSTRFDFVRFSGNPQIVGLNAKRGQRLSWSAVVSGSTTGLAVHLPY
jgi:hypothetical protein